MAGYVAYESLAWTSIEPIQLEEFAPRLTGSLLQVTGLAEVIQIEEAERMMGWRPIDRTMEDAILRQSYRQIGRV